MSRARRSLRKASRGLRTAGIVGASVVAGVGAVAVGSAITARTITRRDRKHVDPYADTRYGEHAVLDRRFVEGHGGTKLNIETAGETGPFLIFSHGFSLDTRVWFHQFEDLATDHRLIAYDLRGHGRSEPAADGNWSLEALGRDLLAIIDETGDEPVVLVGHSMGGMVTVQALALQPELLHGKVRGIVLADTTLGDVVGGLFRFGSPAVRAAIRPMLHALYKQVGQRPDRLERVRGRGTDLEYAWTRLVGFGPKPSHTHVRFMTEMLRSIHSDVWTNLMPTLLELELRHHLPDLAVPVLVTVGSHDRLTPLPAAEAIVEALPNAELLVFEGSGHTPMLERPDEWNAAVRAFVQRLS